MSLLSAVKQTVGSESNPATSIGQINEENTNLETGTYYLSPNGYSGSEPVYCTLENDGFLYANFRFANPDVYKNLYLIDKANTSGIDDNPQNITGNYAQIDNISGDEYTLRQGDDASTITETVTYENPETQVVYPTSFIKSLRQTFTDSFTNVVSVADDQDMNSSNGGNNCEFNTEFFLGSGDPDMSQYRVTAASGSNDPQHAEFALINGEFKNVEDTYSGANAISYPNRTDGGNVFMPTSVEYGRDSNCSGMSDQSGWGYDGINAKVR